METAINILSTKFLIESEVKRLRDAGFQYSFHPFIELQNKDDNKTIERAKEIFESSNKSTLLVFTSVNALRFIYLAQKYATKYIKTAKIACIDGVTLQNSLNFFDAKNVVIKAPNAAKLAEQISKSEFTHIIHFCGNISLGEVSDALSVTNKKVERFIVYETKLTPIKARGKCDGILFFSPSAVQSFYSENNPSTGSVCFAIGSTTAKEISKFHRNKVVVCEKASQQEMVTQAINYFKNENRNT